MYIFGYKLNVVASLLLVDLLLIANIGLTAGGIA